MTITVVEIKQEVQIGDLLLPKDAISTWDVGDWGRDLILRVSEKYYNLVKSRLEQKAKAIIHYSPSVIASEVFGYKSWKRIGITVPAGSGEMIYSIVLSEGYV